MRSREEIKLDVYAGHLNLKGVEDRRRIAELELLLDIWELLQRAFDLVLVKGGDLE